MENTNTARITATVVKNSLRLKFLPRYFGARYMLDVENMLYNELGNLCAEYQSGYWEFYELSNGGCYAAPRGHEFKLVARNGFEGTVSADAAGIVAMLYALSFLSFDHRDIEVFPMRYHQLRNFALEHAEAYAILRAID